MIVGVAISSILAATIGFMLVLIHTFCGEPKPKYKSKSEKIEHLQKSRNALRK